MRQTQLFTKTRKEAPADEVAKNAQLLIRAGYVYKEMAGVYSYLPLGLRVLNKIVQIIREEMNREGGQEIVMTALQDGEVWEKTDRWDDAKVDNWFKTELKNGTVLGLSITHEEPLTRIMKDHISSYRDLPKYAYQFQNKFRNETRAKSGIMRGREFMMKDLYDFSRDEVEHNEFYARMREAYKRVFERVGVGHLTYVTYASGGIFSEFSEEFQTVSDAGEDLIYVDEKTGIALNKEVYTDEVIAKLGLNKVDLVEKKAIESGNIFHLGTKFSEPLGLTYKNEAGEDVPVYMGSYGIGPTRLMGTLVEVLGDDKGLVWPEAVAPFKVHLVGLNLEDNEIKDWAEGVYTSLKDAGVEVLFDDRVEARAGEKFGDSDLIGIPYRVVVSKKGKENGLFEVVTRATSEVRQLTEEQLFADFAPKDAS
ncbi:MAG: prolyl-tRNA synthetase [Candidatus Pacebacteria bacterium]|nr:prolyl-tRNA synthetase [Candidatus Paceibacterota bacterium]MBP9842583.1 prolyl-tRNA synthetase [Candidatus Paceibacterota bacterium]